ncbi:cellulose synthase complex periplasmic endoglucanase BcsZ [Frateuria defendens]|uniref:cellulose synthase complex periplasmic endoglucanase BcsZ n=1 Tax=Frateuria defendens TaxID=2219559 RepID=UPI00066FE186|nr:cellulose synthase complex periplasmic endoglucanase BcsZ [Frateuria defendens]
MAPARFSDSRRRLLQGIAGAAALGLLPRAIRARGDCPGAWPAWQVFAGQHIQPDGRVIDFSTPDRRSTSEAQAYALFFALVANDPARFDRLLGWTRDNLCGGRPDQHLPAWLWGHDVKRQAWQVLDANPASDADLWLAYALLEAGRLWHRPALAQSGRQVLRLVREQEIAELPGFGAMLLPGPQGFAGGGRWRLNPSYLPLQLLRRFAAVDPAGPWRGLAGRTPAMIARAAPAGFAPDWVVWNGKDFVADPDTHGVGSYDAIRVYLWAGMLPAAEPLRAPLLKALGGPLRMLERDGRFAEKIDTRDGRGQGTPSFGFAAALLPYLQAQGRPALLAAQRTAIPAPSAPVQGEPPYYARVLALFGTGWLEGRYRFAADGRLLPGWHTGCPAAG